MRAMDGFDRFGNPESRSFDLGSGDEDRIRGERILLYHCPVPDGPVAAGELTRMMAERGLHLEVHHAPPTRCDLTAGMLAGYTQLWYLSGQTPTLSRQQIQLIADFVGQGNGLAIWADNEPFYADANLLAQALIGCRFSGDKQADRVMTPGAERSRGHFLDHQLTQGVNNLYEGITICTIDAAPPTVTLLGRSHDGQYCMGCYEADGRRVVLDTGFTKLYPDRLHRSAGLGRYLSNIAFWLAKGSRDVEYRLLTSGRESIAAVRQGTSAAAYPFSVAKPAATICVLQWDSPATMQLTLCAPDGTVASHVSSCSPIRVGLQAYLPGTWSAEVTGVDTAGALVPYVLRATQSTAVRVDTLPAQRGGDADGQVIMPFYFLCDVSGSMAGDMDDLAKGLATLHHGLLAEPIVNDLVMMSVILFNDSARTVVPLTAPEDVTLPALPAAAGLTNYSAAFQEFRHRFETDRARLKGTGHRVYRPCVYFLTDGEPTDQNYLQTFEALMTSRNNPAHPYFCAFGFRDASETTLRALAYADAGGPHKRGRWFLALQGHSVQQALASTVEVIGQSILQSARSAVDGAPEVALPAAIPGMVGDRGSA
ncbi:VWA domain-containing protein [Micromonospora sp. AP08]|uniref:vWA domain-containing protein n=1 Tax=Micromonospora sp. AP08 TaxID=2604467 RepID=UPI0011D830B5|nr:VWA domain-containing protein [Micromonospora sp. AP08]TYB38306.1 VWA domain-containing protein [Micromonospora sp. AP08]